MYKTIALIFALFLVGCDVMNDVVIVDPPDPEIPVVNLPEGLRQKNWAARGGGKNGQGSCVHASTIMAFRWVGEEKLADWWRTKHAGGETSVSICKYWKDNGVPYYSTLNEKTYECSGDPKFLKWASDNRIGCPIWWKNSHCCLFTGFSIIDGKEYATVIDNNYPDKIEKVPAEEFIRKWRQDFGGFCIAPATSLAPSPPLPYSIVMPRKINPNLNSQSFWQIKIF